MKSILTLIFFCSLLMFTSPGKAQVANGYEVATWYQFKTSAVTFTLDDNTGNQLPVAIPAFDQYNYKVTLFTVMNWGPNWAGLLQASQNGHEIASHTVSHPSLNTLTALAQKPELEQSQITINANITNAKCLTIAYPNCLIGDRTTISDFYIAGRTCQGVVEPSTPGDFYSISSILCGTDGPVKTHDHFNDKAILAKNSKGWCVFLLHAIDIDGGYSSTSSDELKQHLAYLDANKADYWVSTFANVVKYIKERNAAVVSETAINANSFTVNVMDNLSNTIYNTPLTIRRVLPVGWQAVTASKGGVAISTAVTAIGDKKYIVFDAVPDQGEILISKSGDVVTGLENLAKGRPLSIQSTAFANETELFIDGSFTFSVLTMDGKVLENGSGENTATFGGNLDNGMYILHVKRGAEFYATKIIKR